MSGSISSMSSAPMFTIFMLGLFVPWVSGTVSHHFKVSDGQWLFYFGIQLFCLPGRLVWDSGINHHYVTSRRPNPSIPQPGPSSFPREARVHRRLYADVQREPSFCKICCDPRGIALAGRAHEVSSPLVSSGHVILGVILIATVTGGMFGTRRGYPTCGTPLLEFYLGLLRPSSTRSLCRGPTWSTLIVASSHPSHEGGCQRVQRMTTIAVNTPSLSTWMRGKNKRLL